MPNPLAPGVYIEEVPFASHLTEAVPTNITGFVAITGRGPLLGPLRSFADFERVAPSNPGVNLPLAVRGFFENGGQQCFISQIAGGDSLESGLARLDPQAVSILCCPDDATVPNAAAVMAAHCEKRKDRICILQSPQAVVPVATLQPPVHSSYAVFYYPWITVLSLDRTSSVTIPPGGHLAGVYAQTDAARGVWIAPTNTFLSGVTALSQDLTPAEANALNSLGIDVIQSIPVRGITVTGDRTTRQDSDYQFTAVRRLMIFLEQSISRGAQWAVFEPNGPALWVAVSSSIQNFLTGVWKMGGLRGSTQQEAFFVRCDLTTMTQNDINNGSLILVVGVAPLQPAEFIFLKITIRT
jgi:phage tail sheath protein FI